MSKTNPDPVRDGNERVKSHLGQFTNRGAEKGIGLIVVQDKEQYMTGGVVNIAYRQVTAIKTVGVGWSYPISNALNCCSSEGLLEIGYYG